MTESGTQKTSDFIIIGCGILGLTIARRLKDNHPSANILILEKEASIGIHASGRNSGVVHSGVYYPPGSLKAKMCVDGARQMIAYCDQHNLPISKLGKLILPCHESDESVMSMLCDRATKNGVDYQVLDQKELAEIEPLAHSATGQAIHIPITSVVNSRAILTHIYESLIAKGVEIQFNQACVDVDVTKQRVQTSSTTYHYGHLINTAGMYADTIANACGIKNQYAVIPFKGFYYKLDKRFNAKINKLIYPVPDMNVPFLGVHFTKSISGDIYVGPSAVPALSKEQYQGLTGFHIRECASVLYHVLNQYKINQNGFRNYAHNEIGRIFKSKFTQAAQVLIPAVQKEDLIKSSKVGIRAQLVNTKTNQLVMDFLIEQTDNETHIMNAVSPAFTSSFSCADFVVKQIESNHKSVETIQ